MELVDLGELDLRYTSLESVDYGSDGQLYGTMEGTLVGDRLRGQLRLTNLAARRADNVNLPTLRGLLTAEDGETVWVQLDGVATLRSSDGARVFVTSASFRTGSERYAWVNDVLGLVEGVLDAVTVGGRARARLLECRPTIS